MIYESRISYQPFSYDNEKISSNGKEWFNDPVRSEIKASRGLKFCLIARSYGALVACQIGDPADVSIGAVGMAFG